MLLETTIDLKYWSWPCRTKACLYQKNDLKNEKGIFHGKSTANTRLSFVKIRDIRTNGQLDANHDNAPDNYTAKGHRDVAMDGASICFSPGYPQPHED